MAGNAAPSVLTHNRSKSVGNVGPCTGIAPVKPDNKITTSPNRHVRRLKPQIHEVTLHRCCRAGSQAPASLTITQAGPGSSPSSTDEFCRWEISQHTLRKHVLELIAKIPRDLQERDLLRRAEVWPQEKEHSGTPPHAFEIKPANCTAGCTGLGVLSSTPLALGLRPPLHRFTGL